MERFCYKHFASLGYDYVRDALMPSVHVQDPILKLFSPYLISNTVLLDTCKL